MIATCVPGGRTVKEEMNDTTTLRIHSVESFGTHDGPGIRLVVFTQGCQFRCLFCANPDTFNFKGGREMSLDRLVRLALDEKPYFGKRGGVTISGGEPTIQARQICMLFKRLHQHGINTALDSNGAIFNDDVKALLHETDILLLDVKHISDEWHHKLTLHSNSNTLKVAEYREQTGKSLWLRYVLVPGYSDQHECLHQFGQHYANYKTVEKIEIQPYHTLGVHKWESMGMSYGLQGVQPPTYDQVEGAADIFRQYFKEVKIN
jgi:pyruvate formate lyase activating enzyme